MSPEGATESRADGITFLLTGDGEPEPFLAYEASAVVLDIPEASSDPIDAVVAFYLQKGFALITGPLMSQEFPGLPGWTLKADKKGAAVWDNEGTVMFEAPWISDVSEWLDVVRQRGFARVITGTRLGVTTEDFWPRLDEAVRRGRAVAALIKLQEP